MVNGKKQRKESKTQLDASSVSVNSRGASIKKKLGEEMAKLYSLPHL